VGTLLREGVAISAASFGPFLSLSRHVAHLPGKSSHLPPPPGSPPRYISEDFSGVALHPVDVIDGSSGRLLAALVDGHLETITPVNLPHPRL